MLPPLRPSVCVSRPQAFLLDTLLRLTRTRRRNFFFRKSFHSAVISQAHNTLQGLHNNELQTTLDLGRKFYHPTLFQHIKTQLSKCVLCTVTNTRPNKQPNSGETPRSPKKAAFLLRSNGHTPQQPPASVCRARFFVYLY